MQEFIEYNFYIDSYGEYQLKWTEDTPMTDEINQALKKEKDQIIDAYEDGYEACDLDEVMEVNKKLTSGKLYYNMNYKQNK